MIRKILKGKPNNTYIQLSRYLLVGGIAFIADIASLIVLTDFLGVYYLISAAIAFTIGLAINYLISIYWVFDTRRLKNWRVELFIFTLIGLFGLGFNELIIWFFTEQFLFHYLNSKLISVLVVFVWNFSARKAILFR